MVKGFSKRYIPWNKDKKVPFYERKKQWKVSSNAGWYLPHENICWISERHNKLNRDQQGRLHSDTEIALQYADGFFALSYMAN